MTVTNSSDRASDVLDGHADLHFALLKKHTEFNYLRRARFTVELDSKENFDANYEKQLVLLRSVRRRWGKCCASSC